MQKKNYLRKTFALVMAFLMIVTMLPVNVFADGPTSGTPTAASEEFTEEKAKENWDKVLNDYGYWPLAPYQTLRRVNGGDPVSIYDINYDGSFVDADGYTNLRFMYSELNGVGSGVWHSIIVNFGELIQYIDFSRSYIVSYDGNTKFNFTDLQGYKGVDVTQLYPGGVPRAGKRTNFPMNIVLKNDDTTGKPMTLDQIPQKNYFVQLRLTSLDGGQIYTYAPKGTSIDYSSYTKITSVDLLDNLSSTVLEGPKQEKGERLAIQRSFMSEFIANPIEYDDSSQIGILRTEYLGNRGGAIGENITDVDGKPIGFVQLFDSKLKSYLKENETVVNVDGVDTNIKYVAFTNILTNRREQGSWVKKIGIEKSKINTVGNLSYIVICRKDAVKAFEDKGINAIGVPKLDQYIYQNGIYFSAIDYLIDKTKLNDAFGEGIRKNDFAMASGWAEPNSQGWTIFEKTYDQDYVIPVGEKLVINTTKQPEGKQIMVQVGDKNHSIIRTKQGYYNGNVGDWARGLDQVTETSPATYEVVLKEGATIKKGESIRVLMPDTPNHTVPVSFVNYHNAPGGTKLTVESNSGNVKIDLNNTDSKGDIKLIYTLKGQNQPHEILYKKRIADWILQDDPDGILEGAGKRWITISKLEPAKDIIVKHYDSQGNEITGLTSYIKYDEFTRSQEKYTNLAWIDSTNTLSVLSINKSLYKPYQVVFTNDYKDGTDDFYKTPRELPLDNVAFMTKTDKIQGFTRYGGGLIRMHTEVKNDNALLGKATAVEDDFKDDGTVTKDNSKQLTLLEGTSNAKTYKVYNYEIDLNTLGIITSAGIAARDGEGTTQTGTNKLEPKKDMKLYFTASDGSSLATEDAITRVRTRVLFDATIGNLKDENNQDVNKQVKIVPDNVKYLDDAGYVASGFAGANVQAGTGDAFPDDPTAEGKTFLGWVTEAGKTALGNKTITTADAFNKLAADKKFTAETPVTTHQVVYAVWSEEKLVTFDANGGKFEDGTTEKSVKTNEDKTVTPPAKNPTRDGKEFVGWASSKTATEAEDGLFENITDAKTVYAVWKDAEDTTDPTIGDLDDDNNPDTPVAPKEDENNKGPQVWANGARVVEGQKIKPIKVNVTDDTDKNPTVEVTGLPKGLSYNKQTGMIEGTPDKLTDWADTEEKDFTATITAKDSAKNEATKAITITVLRDTDGDGTPDTTDPDDDNDGINDDKDQDPKKWDANVDGKVTTPKGTQPTVDQYKEKITNLPEGSKVVVKTEPDVSKAGDTTAVVTVTLPNGEEVDVTVPVTVTDTTPGGDDTDKYTPIGQDITVNTGDIPKAKDGIANKGDLPDGTTYSWKNNETPDTRNSGVKKGTVVVTYPDNSTDEVPVKIIVNDPTKQQSDKPTINQPTAGDTTVTGTAAPGATVTVTLPNGTTKDATVDSNGNWSVDTPALKAGETIEAIATEQGKNPSEPAEKTVKGKGSPYPTYNYLTLTLDENYRSGEITHHEVLEGELIERYLYVPRRRGYVFEGWSYDSRRLDEVRPGDRIYYPTTIYAIWSKDRDYDRDEREEEPEDLRPVHDHNAYMFGYTDGTVRPNGKITRAEAAALVTRLLGLDTFASAAKPMFSDTPSSWYNKAINAAVQRGIMKGYPDGRFRPNAPITRAEFTQMISTIDNKPYGVAPFADVKGHWAERAIGSEYQAGRIMGYPDQTFRPNAFITRCEAVVILNKMFERNYDAMSLKDAKNAYLIKGFLDLPTSFWGYYDMIEATNSHSFKRRVEGKVQEDWTLVK